MQEEYDEYDPEPEPRYFPFTESAQAIEKMRLRLCNTA
jgi:hypothetical protein